jgi:hypothetical protein
MLSESMFNPQLDEPADTGHLASHSFPSDIFTVMTLHLNIYFALLWNLIGQQVLFLKAVSDYLKNLVSSGKVKCSLYKAPAMLGCKIIVSY